MYKYKDTVYSDAGGLLVSDNFKGYYSKGNLNDFTEVMIELNTAVYNNGIITFNDGLAPVYITQDNINQSYAYWKTKIINQRYSNDDQIAIMLNKDSGEESDILRYDKMQEWRDWAGRLARKIIDITVDK
jgi:hypothetical protein